MIVSSSCSIYTRKSIPRKKDDVLYTVQCGTFSKYSNAQKRKAELEAKGINDAFITTKKK
ncbi:MAG: SPOR domain-containing protein [Clostridia bacterium]|nr:SPOR domain-containing protein [Clostridia bacterium]